MHKHYTELLFVNMLWKVDFILSLNILNQLMLVKKFGRLI